jgi:dihydroxy-acid dehydratase
MHRDAMTVTGNTIGVNAQESPCWNAEAIPTVVEPVQEKAGIAVLRGNLAPQGAVIKPSAATPALLRHRGRAVVFESMEAMKASIDDPALDIDETCAMVLKGAGALGYPGMPDVGNMPLPRTVPNGQWRLSAALYRPCLAGRPRR